MAANGRPFGVTLVALLAWINGALTIIQGIVTLLNPPVGDDWSGWIAIIIGAITILVSFGLFGGNTAARVIVTIVFVLNLVGALVAMFSVNVRAVVISAVITAALALIGILLLYTRPANAFFRR